MTKTLVPFLCHSLKLPRALLPIVYTQFLVMCVRHKFWTQLVAIKFQSWVKMGLVLNVLGTASLWCDKWPWYLHRVCSWSSVFSSDGRPLGNKGQEHAVSSEQSAVTPNTRSWLLLVLPFSLLLFFPFLFFIHSNQPYMWLWICQAYHNFVFNIILLIIPIFDNISTNKTLKYNIII